MGFVLTLFLLIIGFALLIKGADFFVEGASMIARALGVSSLIIGLTIVAIGTSAPEFMVSTLAAFRGNGDLSLGNIIGSNITNIALILGISAIIKSIIMNSATISREIPFMFMSALALMIVMYDSVLDIALDTNRISRGEGLLFLLFFAIFLYYLVYSALSEKKRELKTIQEQIQKEYPKEKINVKVIVKAVSFLAIGLVGLILGGKFVVGSASQIARLFGLSEALIGLTIVAIGTSLPEAATSIMAVIKNEFDIALGNVVGSNIANTFLIIGVSSVISPISFSAMMLTDVIIMLAVSFVLLLYALNHDKLQRSIGFLFILFYSGYLTYLIIRG